MVNQLKWLLLNSRIVKQTRSLVWWFQGDHQLNVSPEALLLSQHCSGIFNRYDVVVRLLAIEELEGKNDYGQGLYNDLQVSRNAYLDSKSLKIKPEDRHQIKQGTLVELIGSFKKQGFNKQHPVIVNADMKLIDGSHRLACALYFGSKSILVQKASAQQADFSIEWFAKFFESSRLELVKQRYLQLLEQINIGEVLRQVFSQKKQVFGRGGFYQSFEELDIEGQRPTSERYRVYGLDNFLNKNTSVLDIGCNCGFFALKIAPQVQSVVGIEITPDLVEVAQMTQVYLGQTNIKFVQGNFNKHRFKRKFDFICSFAVHYWLGTDMKKYGSRLHSLLNSEGKVLLESQNIEKEDIDWDDKLDAFVSAGFMVLKSGAIRDDKLIGRKFAVLQKL